MVVMAATLVVAVVEVVGTLTTTPTVTTAPQVAAVLIVMILETLEEERATDLGAKMINVMTAEAMSVTIITLNMEIMGRQREP